jgi:sugar/nucleoside kinase (ribokinase family)
MAEVICYGSLAIDEILWLSRWPAPGAGLQAMAETMGLGGHALNIAFGLAQWDHSVAVGGNTIGNDLYGRIMLERLADQGIDASSISVESGRRTPSCTILMAPNGDRTVITRSWEMQQAGPLPSIFGARCLSLDREAPGRHEAAMIGRDSGLMVVASDLTDPDDTLARLCDVVVLSRDVLRAELPQHDPRDYARALCTRGPRVVANTDGPRPAMLLTEERLFWATPPALCIYDKTGAGDSFRAGMIHSLLRGNEPAEVLAFAVAAGTLRCLRPGAAEDPPDLPQVLALAAQVDVQEEKEQAVGA